MTQTGERLTREQAWEKARETEIEECADESNFYVAWDAALANSPLPQVVEALAALVSDVEYYHCDMPDDECFSDQEWYSTPLSQEAIVAARAALKAAKGAMNG